MARGPHKKPFDDGFAINTSVLQDPSSQVVVNMLIEAVEDMVPWVRHAKYLRDCSNLPNLCAVVMRDEQDSTIAFYLWTNTGTRKDLLMSLKNPSYACNDLDLYCDPHIILEDWRTRTQYTSGATRLAPD